MTRADGNSDRRHGEGSSTAIEQLLDVLRESIDADRADATCLRLIVERLERPGCTLDVKEFIAIYSAIDRARDAAWRAGSWSLDSPERARWRRVTDLSKACLMSLTQQWQRTRFAGAATVPSAKIWPSSTP